MFSEKHKGTALTEWAVVVILVVVVVGLIIYSVASTTADGGANVASWIDSFVIP